jgi:hypothetical protein
MERGELERMGDSLGPGAMVDSDLRVKVEMDFGRSLRV